MVSKAVRESRVVQCRIGPQFPYMIADGVLRYIQPAEGCRRKFLFNPLFSPLYSDIVCFFSKIGSRDLNPFMLDFRLHILTCFRSVRGMARYPFSISDWVSKAIRGMYPLDGQFSSSICSRNF